MVITKKRLVTVLSAVIAFVIIAMSLFSTTAISAKAGKAGVEIAGDSIFNGTAPDIKDWQYQKNNGITVKTYSNKAKYVHFDKNYDLENPLISRKKVNATSDVAEAVSGNFELKFKDITANKKFGLALGIEKLNGDVGSSNSSFIYFKKATSGYLYGIDVYSASKEKTELLEPTSVALANDTAVIDFTISNKGRLSLKIGGATVYNSLKDNEVNVSGYMGFTQDGNFTTETEYLDIELKKIKIMNFYDFKPATPLVVKTDFSGNEFNKNDWYLKGSQMVVDNEKYVYNGAGGHCAIASRSEYSNFELEFSVSDAMNKAFYNISVGKVFAASSRLEVTFGAPGSSVESVIIKDWDSYIPGAMLYFNAAIDSKTGERNDKTGYTFVYKDNVKTSAYLPAEFAFFDADFDTTKDVFVKLKMENGVFDFSMRSSVAKEYTELYTFSAFENGFQPNGYVAIWSSGNDGYDGVNEERTFCSIDNIKLSNLDENPTILEREYESNKSVPIPDYNYNDEWTDDYILNASDETGCSAMGASSGVIVAVMMTFACVMLLKRKKAKKTEAYISNDSFPDCH